jgi:hypothetical protein
MRFSERKITVLGWLLVVLAVVCALIGAAPFGGGALFPVLSLPMAAMLARRGRVLTPLLVVGAGMFGFWMAAMPVAEIFDGWMLSGWLGVWTAFLLAGVLEPLPAPRSS